MTNLSKKQSKAVQKKKLNGVIVLQLFVICLFL